MAIFPSPNPAAREKSIPLSPDDPSLRIGAAQKIDALLSCRVAQFNNYSCSAAAVATVINAIRRLSAGPAASRPLSPQEILERVDCHHWRERVSDTGHHGLRGMPLFEFGEVVRAALNAFRIPFTRVDTVGIHPEMDDLGSRRADLRRWLDAMVGSPTGFMIAHFTQGEYFGEWYGGHISPVGAYDRQNERVLILDVDPDCPAPYWVSFDRFFEGLIGRAKVIGSKGGGYVRIELLQFDSI